MEPWSDRELLSRLATGDNAAACELARRYERVIIAAANRHGLPHADRDDLVQTVWETLLSGHDTIRTPDALPGWIRTTAHRLCVQAARRRNREFSVDLAALPIADERPGPEQLTVHAERDHAVRAAFAALPERCRKLLVLDEPRPGYRRLAANVALAEGSIGPTRRRCLDRLRARLADCLDEPG